MLMHIFTLFCGQKKFYGGLFVEHAIVFIVLLYCLLFLGENLRLYCSDGLLNTENVYECACVKLDGSMEERDNTEGLIMEQVMRTVWTTDGVVAGGKSAMLLPYVRPETMNGSDSIQAGQKRIKAYLKYADKNMDKVLDIKLKKGKWLDDGRLNDGSYPAVVTQQLLDEAGWSDGLGRKVLFDGRELTICGVMSGLKQEPLKLSQPVLIMPVGLNREYPIEYTTRIKDGEEMNFRSLVKREFYRLSGDKADLSVTKIEKWKRIWLQEVYVALTLIAVPTVFLLFFAFMGTLGLFWLYSTRRKKEFALRIVVGSTPAGLMKFVIAESLLLTVLAWIPGLLLFFITNPLTVTNLLALGGTCFVMLLFSVFSAWWPARQVSRVKPIEAMREE